MEAQTLTLDTANTGGGNITVASLTGVTEREVREYYIGVRKRNDHGKWSGGHGYWHLDLAGKRRGSERSGEFAGEVLRQKTP